MHDYRYKFEVDQQTLNKVQNFEFNDWIGIVSTILINKPIKLNIFFTEDDAVTRLCELYNLLETKQINHVAYQMALVSVLHELYGKNTKHQQIFELIRVIDYVKPSMFYKKLVDLLINPQYQNMLSVRTEDGLSIHLYLFNTIMKFDFEQNLHSYITYLNMSTQAPEFYQVAIRYLYQLNNQNLFNDFVNNIFWLFSNDDIRDMAISTLEEYLFYKKDASLLFYWLFEHQEVLKTHTHFGKFIDNLSEMLDAEESPASVNHYHVLYILTSLLRKKQLTNDAFERTIKTHFKNKRQFFEFIGRNYENIVVLYMEKEFNYHVLIKDQKEWMTFPLLFEKEITALEHGQRKQKVQNASPSRFAVTEPQKEENASI